MNNIEELFVPYEQALKQTLEKTHILNNTSWKEISTK